MPNDQTSADKARENVAELLKTITATTGVMLALLWGLTQRTITPDVLWLIRVASFVLVVSMVASLLGLQFIVSALDRGEAQVSQVRTVAGSFLVAWLAFLFGCGFLIAAIFRI
jgi:hypothetical protein